MKAGIIHPLSFRLHPSIYTMSYKLRQKLTSRNLSALICVLLILGTTLGCKKISELANKRNGDKSPTPTTRETPANTGAEPDDTLVKKTNAYISECFNKYSNSGKILY